MSIDGDLLDGLGGLRASPVPNGAKIADGFHTLIMQPTTLCNLDCAYCYLPSRKQQRLMPVAVAAACAESVRSQQASHPVDVVWHGGEPTVTPWAHFRQLLVPFEKLRRDGAVRHGIQTNGTRIDRRWLALFAEYDVAVGVSIDGPPSANVHRVDWRGEATWRRTMRGIDLLREHGIPFSVICVVTPETIDRPDQLLGFFDSLGCTSVGFNIEEQEGSARSVVPQDDAYRFWRRLWQLRADGGHVPIRDLDRVAAYVAAVRSGTYGYRPFEPIPTVGYNGETVLLSPELLGIQEAAYDNFHAGNVTRVSIPAMIASMGDLRYVREFVTALAICASECPLFGFCGGAQAGNRYFEHGSLSIAETSYCRNTKQSLVRAAADELMHRRG